jgi:hypothetical protein
VPANNDVTYCSPTTRTCYFLRKTRSLPWAGAKDACVKMGGNLVSYNSGAEQLEVEKYFSGTGGRVQDGMTLLHSGRTCGIPAAARV